MSAVEPVDPPRLHDAAPGHWLIVDANHRIVGCHCGFAANMTDYDYGDEVVAHIVASSAAASELAALRARIEAVIALADRLQVSPDVIAERSVSRLIYRAALSGDPS